jgi:hypothetical protein
MAGERLYGMEQHEDKGAAKAQILGSLFRF